MYKVKVVFFFCVKIVYNKLYNVFIVLIVIFICFINFKSCKMKEKKISF